MAHDLEAEAQRLLRVFAHLGPEDLPQIAFGPSAKEAFDTHVFMTAIFRRAICATAVADELLLKMQAVGFRRDPWTAEILIHRIQNNQELQRVIVDFAKLWLMDFILPCCYKLDIDVTTREMERCAITGIYSSQAFTPSTKDEYGKLMCMRIIPENVRHNEQAQQLIRIFTGGLINTVREKINTAENAILMSETITETFRNFQWSLKPAPRNNRETIRSNLVVERLAPFQVPKIAALRPDSPVILGDNVASMTVICPSQDLCRLHLAAAQIVDDCRLFSAIERYFN
ncbi:predicted protein [Uncinocarpus reesii 1704]|uniref:HNH nuclease domain-containing protein n=1 Tax=Uncinocarpus reesii (strain UAMH 1704) TaxID=336963 RepID=C4JNC8_UNCRE|nr:uncharacterized protein UREG_04334 [Uncinocarpus reesii 1704]EEP79488.1 predicted protein [Uncinocarpus reesii 1704]